MKTTFSVLRSKAFALKSAVASLALVGSVAAHAALPSWATSAPTALGGNVTDYEGLVGPIILAVTVSVVGIKLFKRFTAKI